jgi:DNA ligase D-like protein (predicted 3'-phosphoesterase)
LQVARIMADRLQRYRYREMRDFDVTPEPRGRAPAARKRRLRYYIQRPGATRLHYDLRLELEGVLKSWAVPKGSGGGARQGAAPLPPRR